MTCIDIKSGILCDDIRHEVGETFSLMGIFSPVFMAREFPARRKISVALIVSGRETGEAIFTTSLRWLGEIRWQVETSIEIEEAGGSSVISIGETVAVFDRPGTLILEVEMGGKTVLEEQWEVRSSEAPEPGKA